MKYNPDIHHRRSIRLKGYDYSSAGLYFITICTQNKECLFGEIVGAGSKPARSKPAGSKPARSQPAGSKPALMNPAQLNPAQMILNDAGKMIEYTWNDLPNHNHSIELDEFIIMPNHIHGIIVLTDSERIENERAGLVERAGLERAGLERAGLERAGWERAGLERAGLEPAPTENIMKKSRHGLSEIVRQLKTFSAKRVNKIRKPHVVPMWQRNYYEHVIRNDNELNRIREYINNNPMNWETDDEFEFVGAQKFEPYKP